MQPGVTYCRHSSSLDTEQVDSERNMTVKELCGWRRDEGRRWRHLTKAYRLLSSIMRTAVVDGLIVSSPCRVDGAGVERAAERPIASVSEINALEAAMPEHLRLIVPLATWCQLRRAELLGLRRMDIDLKTDVIRVEQSRTITMHGKSLTKEPKDDGWASDDRASSVPWRARPRPSRPIWRLRERFARV